MSEQGKIPVLTDLIERGMEITLSDLGLEDEGLPTPTTAADEPDIEIDLGADDLGETDPLAENPALEQAIRRILDEHMELAWQEIKLVIQRELQKK